MLDVNNVLPTLYKDRKMKIFSGFDDVVVDEKRKTKDERRKTKDERRKTSIEKKNSRKKKVNFQNKCVSSQTKMWEKRAPRSTRRPFCLPTFSQRAVRLLSSGRTGSVLPWKPSAFSRKVPLTTKNVLLTKRT